LLTIDNKAGYLNSFSANVRMISSLFDLEEKVTELLSGFNARVAALAEKAAGSAAIIGMVTNGSFNTVSAIRTRASKAAREVMENEFVMKTDAYKNGRIVYLTSDAWYLAEGGIMATDTMPKDLEAGVK